MKLEELARLNLQKGQVIMLQIRTGSKSSFEQKCQLKDFVKNRLVVEPLGVTRGYKSLGEVNIAAILSIIKDEPSKPETVVENNIIYLGDRSRGTEQYKLYPVHDLSSTNVTKVEVANNLSRINLMAMIADSCDMTMHVLAMITHVGQPRAYADSLLRVELYTKADKTTLETWARNIYKIQGIQWYDRKLSKLEKQDSYAGVDFYLLEATDAYTD